MAIHSLVKIYAHAVWGTYYRERTLINGLQKKLYEHLLEKAAEYQTSILELNIQPEHLHLLLQLPADKTIAQIIKNFKGESTHWINENNFVPGKFLWQRGYGAFSVSQSQLEKVKSYIRNQDTHHKRLTFKEEYDRWAWKYGVSKSG